MRAYNLLQVAPLDQVADALGYEDMEMLIMQIETIRIHQERCNV